MALTFGGATSDRVNHGSATVLDNLDPFTWIVWLYPTTLTNGRTILSKSSNKVLGLSGTAGNVIVGVVRTSSTQYVTNSTPLSATNTWIFLAITFNSGAGAGQIVNVYKGTLAAIAAEATYASATDGSGANTSDAAGDFIGGNGAGLNVALQGRIAQISVWNRELSLGEIKEQQFNPHPASGCVLFCNYGFNGTGSQPDHSGNGNTGTVTGATQIDHVPLQPQFGLDNLLPYIVSSAGSQTISPTGLVSAEAFGSDQLNFRLFATGIASLEAFGASKLNLRLSMTGIPSGEVFGTDKINLRIFPTSVGSAEAFGLASLGLRLIAVGIVSAEAFGLAKVNLRIFASSILSEEQFGTAFISNQTQFLIAQGIASAEAFGSTTVIVVGPVTIVISPTDWTIDQLPEEEAPSDIPSVENIELDPTTADMTYNADWVIG